ncbi:MAG: GNAT family N-acetyltransferase [Sphingomonadaceae bacterium]
MIQIVPLSRIDAAAVEALLDEAFGADRKARTAYQMRLGTTAIAPLSFAARDDAGRLVGTLQSWPVKLVREEGGFDALTLVGPVAVLPDLQRGGIGRSLMAALIDAADRHGHDGLMMIGDPEYYGRFFGFSAEATGGWTVPGPVERHRLLARITRPGGVAAVGTIEPNP